MRERAAALGLRTAAKPDSQDVCFITAPGGRRELPRRSHRRCTPAASSTPTGAAVGEVDAVELVTVGQRRGLGARRRRAGPLRVDVDVATRGGHRRPRRRPAHRRASSSDAVSFVGAPSQVDVLAQCSAHGEPRAGTARGHDASCGRTRNAGSPGPERRVLRPVRHRARRRRHRRVTARQVWERPRSTIAKRRRSTSAGSNPAVRCQSRESRRSTSHPSSTVPDVTAS